MVRAYLLSFLARQQLLLKEGFAQRYPNPWLVWEPGSWRAPPLNASIAETHVPRNSAPTSPQPGDALCFELSTKWSKEKPVTLGRADDSELVISDMTVSREHCRLWVEGTTWHVQACELVKSMKVGGRAVTAGGEVRVAAGEALDLGEVKLTLLDPSRFLDRVTSVSSKL